MLFGAQLAERMIYYSLHFFTFYFLLNLLLSDFHLITSMYFWDPLPQCHFQATLFQPYWPFLWTSLLLWVTETPISPMSSCWHLSTSLDCLLPLLRVDVHRVLAWGLFLSPGSCSSRLGPARLSHLCTGLLHVSVDNSQGRRGWGDPRPGPSNLGLVLRPRYCCNCLQTLSGGAKVSQAQHNITTDSVGQAILDSSLPHLVSSNGLLHSY